MHIAKLQEKKDKCKHSLGGLQESLDHSSWIIATMGMVGLANNIIGLIEQSMKKMENQLAC